jgi:peptidoglycan/LPS O-acetylase OafA/YrhL
MLVVFFVFSLLSLLAAHLLYTYLEKPARSYLRKRWIKS